MDKDFKTFDTTFWWIFTSFLVAIGLLLLLPYLLTQLSIFDWGFSDRPGEIGDAIGGTLGPFIAIAAAILTFFAFWVQYKANTQQREQFISQLELQRSQSAYQDKIYAKERFESKFFDLIKLHRDNVSELRYKGKDSETSEGRKVFRLIFQEFSECLKEVRNYAATDDAHDYIKPRYLKILKNMAIKVNPKIRIYDLLTIDIAFCVVFYGLGEEGEVVLRRLFLRKYQAPFCFKLIEYLKLKPKARYKNLYDSFSKLRNLPHEQKLAITDEIYDQRSNPNSSTYSANTLKHLPQSSYEKYYGGHQHRLGHYFRHLFQCYKFLNNQELLNEDEKYFYGKTLRAQLSTYEQALLFVDSITSLGFKWEFTPEESSLKSSGDLSQKLITKYQLIKNLPGNQFLNIKFKDYYPGVIFESDEVMAGQVPKSNPTS